MSSPRSARADLWPSLGIVVASIGWGLFWLPLRAIEAMGVTGSWATVAVFAPGALVLAPLALWRVRRAQRVGGTLLITGLFSGGAWVLYSDSLLFTEVVRALLLFYLTPLWSTLLARAFLGEPITPPRLVTIAMGLGGLVVILGFEGGFPLPRNAGDWLGLASGLVWACASVRLRGAPAVPVIDGVIAFFLGGAVLSAGAAVASGAPPQAWAIVEALPFLTAVSIGFIVPSMVLIIGGAQRLSPGRVGILLMTEAVVGTLSAALLSDEPFGLREIAGATLVIAAGAIDVLWVGRPRSGADPGWTKAGIRRNS